MATDLEASAEAALTFGVGFSRALDRDLEVVHAALAAIPVLVIPPGSGP